jgi:hypothetical protein
MLAVAQIDYIRHEVNQKGETYASLSQVFIGSFFNTLNLKADSNP